ncbi:peptide deformylase, partial [Patescibacteria group bacterium]|nr:peptide deformylase [Patescibacteria group bacterium]
IQTGKDNKILRKKSADIPIEEIKKFDEAGLFEAMIAKMYEDDGIGLAAPQIGQSIQLCVIGKSAVPNGKDLILINPKITYYSKKTTLAEEGCLSLPGVEADVERPAKIRLKGVDKNGEKITLKAKGLFARVLQHEIDHLEGILFIDRIKE